MPHLHRETRWTQTNLLTESDFQETTNKIIIDSLSILRFFPKTYLEFSFLYFCNMLFYNPSMDNNK